jgi:hypothetical protein
LVLRFGLCAGVAVVVCLSVTTTSDAQSKTTCKASTVVQVPHDASILASSIADIRDWKAITLGEYQNIFALRSAFDNSPCPIGLSDSVDEAIGRPGFPFTKTKVELDLVIVSATDLGFSQDGASLQDIYYRAKAIGLELCPADLAPSLRLTYLDQPRGEFLHTAMQPVALYNGELVDFSLGNDGNRFLLLSGDGHPETVLPGAVRFIFVKPRVDAIARENAPSNSGSLAKR